MSVFHLPFQYSNMLKMRVASLKSNLQYLHMKKTIISLTFWPPFFTAHLGHFGPCHGRGTINICTKTVVFGQDGDSKCRGCWSQPRNCSKKTIRLTDGALCCASFLDACLKDEIEIPTSWRSTVPLLSFFWEKAFPTHSKSVISTAQLARLNWASIYCPPVAWGKYDQVSRKSTSEFPNQPLVLVGGLASKQKLQNTFFFRYSVDGKKSAPVDMVNI